MPGGAILAATADTERIEAPVTVKAYLMCIFAAFGGFFFGYDSGYIGGVLGMNYFIHQFQKLPYPAAGTTDPNFVISSSNNSLIVSILSAGTFFGAVIAGDLSDWFGRRTTIIAGCLVFAVGVVLQIASSSIALLAVGRIIAGFGVGFVSAIIILYMSEIAPRKVRGAIVAGYQFAVTIGLMTASCVDYGTQNRTDSGSYRIPIAIQLIPAIILGTGLFFLPESPRYFVIKGQLDRAAQVLSRVRGQPVDSEYIQQELAEIVANHEYEMSVIPQNGYFSSWANCFKGSLFKSSSNLRRTILGTSLQMMQQWTGVNFIFYYSTIFLKSLGTIHNVFLISMIFTIVNVFSTPISFYTIERYGRRTLLVWGALGMVICQFIVAAVGTALPNDQSAIRALIAFICIYIFFFASTWGPGAWVVVGEIFPIPIRSRGVGLSTASNWLWNCIIAVITPYMVGEKYGNLGAKVFFIWGALCTACLVYSYFLIPETKGLSLEQVDRMFEETTPRESSKWVPHSTFAADMGLTEKIGVDGIEHVEAGSKV
ncbi:Major facilitator-type transporter ecdD [Hyphodiscus hymeniophilus]|uniref:Major facilitator-type transporter ecdD n=1 Tax=Hyphodiscus hymeniophilus TaxID=353542 RepID=A0A9P6VET0_9HELO|nr:Major facilitator-type transporter ecdD [Hyphodiscus hymeniophilus]